MGVVELYVFDVWVPGARYFYLVFTGESLAVDVMYDLDEL